MNMSFQSKIMIIQNFQITRRTTFKAIKENVSHSSVQATNYFSELFQHKFLERIYLITESNQIMSINSNPKWNNLTV